MINYSLQTFLIPIDLSDEVFHAISGIGRHFGVADWLGWLCGTNSLDLMYKCFLGRLELKTPTFFLRNQYNKKKLLLEIERTLLFFDYL